ncbi:hypothetical protein CVT26_009702 [Gymnopilus dilepis]|uniref:Uncharacterized protein n=1 Tax=Gymnopilus dilepis TaxID=231916 RepID=A0A409YBM7_9AGAR|nr:hypothetical protein CVT26_009702 [Gymnopilus dilepis]
MDDLDKQTCNFLEVEENSPKFTWLKLDIQLLALNILYNGAEEYDIDERAMSAFNTLKARYSTMFSIELNEQFIPLVKALLQEAMVSINKNNNSPALSSSPGLEYIESESIRSSIHSSSEADPNLFPAHDVEKIFAGASNDVQMFRRHFEDFGCDRKDFIASLQLAHPSAVRRLFNRVLSEDELISPTQMIELYRIFGQYTNSNV